MKTVSFEKRCRSFKHNNVLKDKSLAMNNKTLVPVQGDVVMFKPNE